MASRSDNNNKNAKSNIIRLEERERVVKVLTVTLAASHDEVDQDAPRRKRMKTRGCEM